MGKGQRRRRSRSYVLLQPHGGGRAEAAEGEARRSGERARSAEKFGRTVSPTPSGFEDAVRDRGPDGLAAALIARANMRWENVVEAAPFSGSIVFPRMWRAPSVDHALATFGANYRAGPDAKLATSYLGDHWPDQLRWGIDAVACAAKYLLLFQVIGAAALLRQQAERWTDNRAHALGITRPTDMGRADFISLVWSKGYGRRLDLGAVYRTASDALHGRGPAVELIKWESAGLAKWPPPQEAIHIAIMAELSVMTLHQITACVLDISATTRMPAVAETQYRWRDVGDPPRVEVYPKIDPTLLPLTPVVLAGSLPRDLIIDGEIYENQILDPQDPLSLPEESLVVLAYLHRRHRACQVAIHALDRERQLLGPEFDIGVLASHETRYVLVAELASLVGTWTGGRHGDSLIVGASALRSAFQLWLEDDSRAMIAVRTMFESTARARAWRLKPTRAERLERREETSGRDWFRAAGWNRLGLVGTALGELSHMSYESRWEGALRALAEVHGSGQHPLHTGRGGTLSRGAYMLAIESIAQLETISSVLADSARHVIGASDGDDKWTEKWMQKAAGHKSGFDFGDPIFRPFTSADIDQMKRKVEREMKRSPKKKRR